MLCSWRARVSPPRSPCHRPSLCAHCYSSRWPAATAHHNADPATGAQPSPTIIADFVLQQLSVASLLPLPHCYLCPILPTGNVNLVLPIASTSRSSSPRRGIQLGLDLPRSVSIILTSYLEVMFSRCSCWRGGRFVGRGWRCSQSHFIYAQGVLLLVGVIVVFVSL
jgi:hypothetical protein